MGSQYIGWGVPCCNSSMPVLLVSTTYDTLIDCTNILDSMTTKVSQHTSNRLTLLTSLDRALILNPFGVIIAKYDNHSSYTSFLWRKW